MSTDAPAVVPAVLPERIAGLAPRTSPHGRLMAVSMMKDEGPFVLEWIAHHLAVGFTDILVYTNDCSDGTDAMLRRLEVLGLAHHRANVIPQGLRPQPSALNHAQEEPLVAAADWLMVFDADEFLCIRHGDGTLDGLIGAAKARGANGIVVTWRIFGSGGVHHWSRAPVSEQYLMAAPVTWNKGWGVKTLFTYDPEHWKLGIHRPKMKNKWLETEFPATVHWLNGSGAPMEDYFKFRGWRSITRTVGYDWVQLNHYAVKSIDSYAMRKFRGNVNFKADKYNADYWALQDRNEVRDDTMLRYAAERGRIFDLLLTDPELARLHHAALERAEARLAAFRDTPAYAELVAGLKAASAVPIDAVEAKPPQPRDAARIAALMSRVEKTSAETARAERRAPPADRPAGGVALYLAGMAADLAPDPAALWQANHDILLPADPGFFTPAGLTLIGSGKFERNLARNLPRLVGQGATYLELGAASGFLAALLARTRGDVTVVVQPDPGWATMVKAVFARNGLETHPRLRLLAAATCDDEAALSDLLATHRPTGLSLGDPGLEPDLLAAALSRAGLAPPDLVILSNRLLSARFADLERFEAVLKDWGVTERSALDATLSVAYRRPAG